MTRQKHLGRWWPAGYEERLKPIEDQIWQEWFTTQPEALDLEGRFGTTRVYHWPGVGDPVVLLHGMGGTSIMWHDFVENLGGRPIYAVDTMGDAGRSVHRVGFTDCADLAVWLDETLVGLGLDRAHLVGNSYGAWMALNLAARTPDRVASISLLDPGGLAKLNLVRFCLWGGKILVTAFMPGPVRRRAARRLRFSYLTDKRMRLGLRVQIHHPFRLPIDVLTHEQLRAIEVPTLLLVGARSEAFDPLTVFVRAQALIRDLEAEIIPDVGHALPIDPKAEAPRRVCEFLARLADRHDNHRHGGVENGLGHADAEPAGTALGG